MREIQYLLAPLQLFMAYWQIAQRVYSLGAVSPGPRA